jgi:transcriptional regulator with XRE-family HTH domain
MWRNYNASMRRSSTAHHGAQRKHVVEILKQLRTDAGLRQLDLAGRLSRPQSFVSKYELGERQLNIIEIREICNALGISLHRFVDLLEKSLSGEE